MMTLLVTLGEHQNHLNFYILHCLSYLRIGWTSRL